VTEDFCLAYVDVGNVCPDPLNVRLVCLEEDGTLVLNYSLFKEYFAF